MFKISLDNPILVKIAFLLFGLIGFMVVQLLTNNMNYFSLQFIFLSIIELYFLVFLANELERKNDWQVVKINPIIAYIVLILKIYLLVILVKNGFVESFDDRLAIYGSSFFIGINMALGFILFPFLNLFGSSIFIKKVAIYLWLTSTFLGTILAPSKSAIIGIVASLLFYRFLKRKIAGNLKVIPLISFKSIGLFFFVIFGTLLFLYYKVGLSGLTLFVYRIANNFDLAIYASQISTNIYPEHSNLYYAILPLLKKIDPLLYELKYYSIPQWVLWEHLNIARFGRYGYPNDNLIVGLLISFKDLGIIIYLLIIGLMYKYIRYFKKLKKISILHLFYIFLIPSIFASLQDSTIKLYAFIFIYIFTITIYSLLPKKHKRIDTI